MNDMLIKCANIKRANVRVSLRSRSGLPCCFCTKGSAVSGRSALRYAVRGDLVVPGHMMEWGLKAFAVAGHSCWSGLPIELRDL